MMRIAKELDCAQPKEIVWFLVPTVELCTQQCLAIQKQIPTAEAKILSGSQGVHTWSTQRVWDAVLEGTRVVVATYQVLLDALRHAFVSFENIPLLVIDEAHNCTGKGPLTRIMKDHYFERQIQGKKVPRILGLTASPVIRSRPEDVDKLEKILDASCISPHIHREDLMKYVNRPELIPIKVNQENIAAMEPTRTYQSLMSLPKLYILMDPYVKHLQLDMSERGRRRLGEVIMRENTWTHKSLSSLRRKATAMMDDLGRWAVDYFVSETVTKIQASSRAEMGPNLLEEEQNYLLEIIGDIELPSCLEIQSYKDPYTVKVHQLLTVLHCSKAGTCGIIFVKERATTVVLESLLSGIPMLKNRFKIGSMVGASARTAKQDIAEVLNPSKNSSLKDFRTGRVNLLIATSVLEEGIDVPACNLVICFDPPRNLKSFIQRRGRARMKKSSLVILDDGSLGHDVWEQKEAEMRARYEDQDRVRRHVSALEDHEEEVLPDYIVEATGASLPFDEAISHLQHFCNCLSSRRFADTRPEYISRPAKHQESGLEMLEATVELPISLPQHLRSIRGSKAWQVEKNAFHDAAFQAYKALHQAGLVNDNLLPADESEFQDGLEIRESETLVRPQYNPWLDISEAWREGHELSVYAIRLWSAKTEVEVHPEIFLSIPVRIPPIPAVPVFFSPAMNYWYDVRPYDAASQIPASFQDYSVEILSFAFMHRFAVTPLSQIVHLHSTRVPDLGHIAAFPFEPGFVAASEGALVRDPSNIPYYYQGVLEAKPDAKQVQKRYQGFEKAPENVPYVLAKRFPRMVKPQHELDPPTPTIAPASTITKYPTKYPTAIAMPDCKMDSAPAFFAQLGLCIPDILRSLELTLVAKKLVETLLRPVNISDVQLVLTAICASKAAERNNYEKLEFLGDTILKLSTSVNCAATKIYWSEGFLSKMKDHFISNAHLCKATVASGLDQFIIAEGWKRSKWKPSSFIDKVLSNPLEAQRMMSTKTLADVIESLIGASYLNGGFPKALACINVFLPSPKMQWRSLEDCHKILFDDAPSHYVLPPDLKQLEKALGYTFRKKAILLQALTHSSYGIRDSVGSLDRLEFIGDAVLDYVIIRHLFPAAAKQNSDPGSIGLGKMHELRTALVNAHILGFLCMEWKVGHVKTCVKPFTKRSFSEEVDSPLKSVDVKDPSNVTEVVEEPLALWKYLRFGNSAIAQCQEEMLKRYEQLGFVIRSQLMEGSKYPWHLLAMMQIPKFYSDIVEAIIGAVWVDSGCMDTVDEIVQKLGLIGITERFLQEQVDTTHPKVRVGILAKEKKVRYHIYYINKFNEVVSNNRNEVSDDGSMPDGTSEESEQSDTNNDMPGDRSGTDNTSSMESEQGKIQYCCQLFIGDTCRVNVTGGLSREEIRIKAAEEAVTNWSESWVEENQSAEEGTSMAGIDSLDEAQEVG